uniref:Uncharacterized protein n=1 Tax=Noctiluca scintillans TaxID=2966 RepID=A0A7S1ACL3_NOCSC
MTVAIKGGRMLVHERREIVVRSPAKPTRRRERSRSRGYRKNLRGVLLRTGLVCNRGRGQRFAVGENNQRCAGALPCSRRVEVAGVVLVLLGKDYDLPLVAVKDPALGLLSDSWSILLREVGSVDGGLFINVDNPTVVATVRQLDFVRVRRMRCVAAANNDKLKAAGAGMVSESTTNSISISKRSANLALGIAAALSCDTHKSYSEEFAKLISIARSLRAEALAEAALGFQEPKRKRDSRSADMRSRQVFDGRAKQNGSQFVVRPVEVRSSGSLAASRKGTHGDRPRPSSSHRGQSESVGARSNAPSCKKSARENSPYSCRAGELHSRSPSERRQAEPGDCQQLLQRLLSQPLPQPQPPQPTMTPTESFVSQATCRTSKAKAMCAVFGVFHKLAESNRNMEDVRQDLEDVVMVECPGAVEETLAEANRALDAILLYAERFREKVSDARPAKDEDDKVRKLKRRRAVHMAAARVTADFVRLEQLEFDTVDATSAAQEQPSRVHREFAAQQLELEETRERLEDAEVRLSLLDAQCRVQESSIGERSLQSLAEMRAAAERHAGLLVELRASTSQELELRGELIDQARQQVELRAELRQAIGDRTGFQLESIEIEDDDHETCELRAELLEATERSESSRGPPSMARFDALWAEADAGRDAEVASPRYLAF